MATAQNSWEKFLNPVSFKQSLIATSVYLAAYEMLKTALIHTLRNFFSDDLCTEALAPISEQYRTKVLALHKSEMTACATWFLNSGALIEDDLLALRELADHRNQIAHELPSFVASDREVSLLHLKAVFALTTKIDSWWIRNVEIPLNPDFGPDDLTEEQLDGCMSMRCLVMSLMIEVAEGNDARLAELYSLWSKHNEAQKAPNRPTPSGNVPDQK